MCDARTENAVRDKVAEFVTAGYMFTAYDVTKSLRNSGEQVKHHEVNDVVQAMFNNGDMNDYNRDVKDIGAPVKPFIYYSPYSDLNLYDKDWLTNDPTQKAMANKSGASGSSGSSGYQPASLTPASPAAAKASFPATIAAILVKKVAAKAPTGGRLITKEGRLTIPIHTVVNFGMKPHQAVYIYKGKIAPALVLTQYPPAGPDYSAAINQLMVNRDGRIRLSQVDLKKISTGNCFKVSRSVDALVVEPY